MQKHDSPSCAFLQLAGPAVDADAFYSPKFRAFAVDGGAMSPTLNIGDFAMVLPVSEFRGDGIYLVDQGNGVSILYRAQLWDCDEIHLSQDAIPHHSRSMSRGRFNERVLAMVVAEVRVTEPHIINQAVGLAA